MKNEVELSEDEEDEENIPTSKPDFWHITAHVHGKDIHISCGDATQRLKWLAHVAIARWDEEENQGWKRLGIPIKVRSNDKLGPELDINSIIRDILQNGDHVFVESSLSPNETK